MDSIIVALSNQNEEQALSALGALAHAQRLRTFRALVVVGLPGLTPSVLADQLGIARNALSFHLKELAHWGGVPAPPRPRPATRPSA